MKWVRNLRKGARGAGLNSCSSRRKGLEIALLCTIDFVVVILVDNGAFDQVSKMPRLTSTLRLTLVVVVAIFDLVVIEIFVDTHRRCSKTFLVFFLFDDGVQLCRRRDAELEAAWRTVL